ncbi:MAG: OmpA family protein, partial [Gammaproteobacteria bacterium]|nr:OmpA family protein [Gammaproteobacteria bacterium]
MNAPAGYLDGPSTLIPPEAAPLDPTGGPDPFLVSLQPVPPTGGDSTVYYLGFLLETGDPDVINNHVPLDPVSGITVSKRALKSEIVVGGLAAYEIVVTNPGPIDLVGLDVVDTPPATFVLVDGSAMLDGSPVTTSGSRPIVFSGIDIAAGGSATINYILRAGAGVVPGNYRNSAFASLNGAAVSNVATAEIAVTADSDFSETTIIGKVFNDLDGDGWQDDGESGIPGVRLATVTGLLIETDQYGRFHIAGVDGGFMERGRNFILKVDPATLPPGTEFTTENPRVLRITQGLLNRIDFGVRVPGASAGCCSTVEAKLSEFFFTSGSAELRPEYQPIIKQLADKLREHGGGVLTIKGSAEQGRESADLAQRRAEAVRRALQQYLGEEFMKKVEIRTQAPEAGSALRIEEAKPGFRARAANLAGRGVLALLSLVAGPAHAQEMCSLETCRTDDGYLVEFVEHDPVGGNGESRYAVRDPKHVDLSGQFGVALPGSGMVWATEDPAVANPRLAVQGPSVAPAADGRIQDPLNFTIYTNYAAFIDKAELVIYDGDDVDLVEPLAVLPLTLTGLNAISWDGVRLDGQRYLPDDELLYLVRASDSEGRVDETGARSVTIVDARGFNYSQGGTAASAVRSAAVGQPALPAPKAQLPLAGNVLVMRPPSAESRQYTLTPRFGTRKTNLSASDRAELDKIIASWKDATNIKLVAVGHTDNIRIAPQNRKEFANNQVLSEARAASVAGYIASGLGLSGSQVTAIGRGPAQPVASNATAEGRARNRRVELSITGELVLANADIRLISTETGKEQAVDDNLDAALSALSVGAATPTQSVSGQRTWRSGEGLTGIYGQNDLVQQNIPVYGSRVRVYGHGVQENLDLVINGHPLPVDREGRFAVEYLMPVGKHQFAVGFLDANGSGQNRFLNVDVTGRHMFLVGLADVTVSGSDLSGSIEPLAGDERYQEDFLVEGRLAFYLKGKVKGKYLVTAQMDTQEEELGDLFKNIHRKDPRSVFRRLDPDKYYPVYGDDSTTYNDTDTQGRMYVRVDWDKSQALWGNYHTGVTGNEFGQYNRSLYGARLHNRSLETTELGEAKRDATVFLSEAQTSLGHSEFLGTGGSLYYLRDQDILPGSEKAHIEIRDRDSNRVVNNITLVRGTDYEIDELQGRII